MSNPRPSLSQSNVSTFAKGSNACGSDQRFNLLQAQQPTRTKSKVKSSRIKNAGSITEKSSSQTRSSGSSTGNTTSTTTKRAGGTCDSSSSSTSLHSRISSALNIKKRRAFMRRLKKLAEEHTPAAAAVHSSLPLLPPVHSSVSENVQPNSTKNSCQQKKNSMCNVMTKRGANLDRPPETASTSSTSHESDDDDDRQESEEHNRYSPIPEIARQTTQSPTADKHSNNECDFSTVFLLRAGEAVACSPPNVPILKQVAEEADTQDCFCTIIKNTAAVTPADQQPLTLSSSAANIARILPNISLLDSVDDPVDESATVAAPTFIEEGTQVDSISSNECAAPLLCAATTKLSASTSADECSRSSDNTCDRQLRTIVWVADDAAELSIFAQSGTTPLLSSIQQTRRQYCSPQASTAAVATFSSLSDPPSSSGDDGAASKPSSFLEYLNPKHYWTVSSPSPPLSRRAVKGFDFSDAQRPCNNNSSGKNGNTSTIAWLASGHSSSRSSFSIYTSGGDDDSELSSWSDIKELLAAK